MPDQDQDHQGQGAVGGWRRAGEAAVELREKLVALGVRRDDLCNIQRSQAEGAGAVYLGAVSARSVKLVLSAVAGEEWRRTPSPAAAVRAVLTALRVPDYDVAKIADREDLGGRRYVHLGTMRLASVELILAALPEVGSAS